MTSAVPVAYRRLFAIPASRRLSAADLCARLPQGMLSITILLVAAQHAPMRDAGLALAGCTLGLAATAPARGRLADRRGVSRAAALCCAGYAAALLGLLAAALEFPSPALLAALATAAGCCMPPLSPGMRGLWSDHVPAALLATALALDAAVFDLAYIAGPVIAGSLAAGVAPAASLGLMLALTVAATAIIGAPFPHESTARARARALDLLRSPTLRGLLATAALTNAALSATEVALTASVRMDHALWAAGPLLAELSIGSILGSLLLGARMPAVNPRQRLPRLLAGYAFGLAVLTTAARHLPLLALAAPCAGLCLGPTLATLFTTAAATAPRGGSTEAQAWLNSIMNGGAAGGAALAGLTASQPGLGLALAAATATAAAVTATLTRASRNRR